MPGLFADLDFHYAKGTPLPDIARQWSHFLALSPPLEGDSGWRSVSEEACCIEVAELTCGPSARLAGEEPLEQLLRRFFAEDRELRPLEASLTVGSHYLAGPLFCATRLCPLEILNWFQSDTTGCNLRVVSRTLVSDLEGLQSMCLPYVRTELVGENLWIDFGWTDREQRWG